MGKDLNSNLFGTKPDPLKLLDFCGRLSTGPTAAYYQDFKDPSSAWCLYPLESLEYCLCEFSLAIQIWSLAQTFFLPWASWNPPSLAVLLNYNPGVIALPTTARCGKLLDLTLHDGTFGD